jgi:hypothetical protein
MFDPIHIPFGCVMLFNVVRLKEDAILADVEWALGEICSVVTDNFGGDNGGFIGGQFFKYNGFVSEAGSFDPDKTTEDHIVIITYWRSFDHHENSHADELFREKFSALSEYCEEIYEVGYEMLWQGMPDNSSSEAGRAQGVDGGARSGESLRATRKG